MDDINNNYINNMLPENDLNSNYGLCEESQIQQNGEHELGSAVFHLML